ncbi:MAG: hypothetical protein ACI9WS_000036 [Paraglaciecola psychrophila]|jgi:hypothetical protein
MQLQIAKTNAASDLIGQFDPSDEARPLLDKNLSALELINRLVQHACYPEAIKCVALVLPVREAVWWSCLAVKQAMETPSDDEQKAIAAAEAWAISPSEKTLLAARAAAELIGNSNTAAWPALAVGWSGNMVVEEGQDPIAAPPTLSAHATACAVTLAAAADPELSDSRSLHFIKQGLDLANGGKGNI